MAQPLALELYHAIIEHVDTTGDLLSLALCCSAFRDEAQRCLFHHVEPESEDQDIQFISAINASPLHLGLLVRSYCIVESGTYEPGTDMYAHLSLALRAMCNLEHLRNDSRTPMTVLRGCTFKLQTFVWNPYLEKCDKLFLFRHFLPTQPSIKCLELYLGTPFNDAELPRNLCPQLDFLSSYDKDVVAALLRDDRLITRFECIPGVPMNVMTIQQINHLKCILIDIMALVPGRESPHLDIAFNVHLTGLILLEIQTDFVAESLLPKLQFLRNLSSLEVLILGIWRGKPGRECDIQHLEYTSSYQFAFEVCPTLKYIDVGQLRRDIPPFNRIYRPRPGDHRPLEGNTLVHAQEVLLWRKLGLSAVQAD